MKLEALTLILSLASFSVMAADSSVKSPAQLNCEAGPIIKTYGGTSWLVYACDDMHSLTLVSAPGSKAMPFVFTFHWQNGQYQLAGVGTGNKAATDAAFADIHALTGTDILRLLAEVKSAAEQKKPN